MNPYRRSGTKETFGTFLGVNGIGWGGIAAIIFGSLCLSLLGSALYDLITGSIGHSRSRLAIIALVSVLILLVVAILAARFLQHFRQPPRPRLGGDMAMPSRRALLAFVSMGSGSSHTVAIDHHTRTAKAARESLDCVVLLHSSASHDRAWDYKRELQSQPDHPAIIEPRPLMRLYDVRSCYRTIQEEINRMLENEDFTPRLQQDDIVLDVTGGSAMFTAAGVLVGLNRNLAIEYVEPGMDKEGNPDGSAPTVKRVVVDWFRESGTDSGWSADDISLSDFSEPDLTLERT